MSRQFRAMYWKELREGSRWGLIGLAITTLAYLWLHYDNDPSGMPSFSGAEPASYMLSTLTTFAAYATGAMIGVGQALPDHTGDRWGFLTHRPMTRSSI